MGRHPTRIGWGYSEYTPSDADSTIYVLNLAQILGEHNRRIEDGYDFIVAHCQKDGGISTYRSSAYMRRVLKFDRVISSFHGWCRSHTDVTANVANLAAFPQREQALVFLRKNQHSDGSWTGYWWYDPEFTSALAVKALSQTGNPEDNLRIGTAMEWAMKRVDIDGMVRTVLYPSGSTFATALVLRILRFGAKTPKAQQWMEKSTSWLLSKQHEAGFWHPSATLRLPYPSDTSPDDYKNWRTHGKGDLGEIISDTRKIYTTALVLETLLDVKSFFGELDHEA